MSADFGSEGAPGFELSRLPLRQLKEKQQTEAMVQQLKAERTMIRAAFASPRGQAALRLLRRLFKHPAAYYTDPMLMQFFEGQRSVVEYIEEALGDER